VAYDPDDPAAAEVGLKAVGGAGRLDVTRPVDHLRAADDVKRDGHEEVNGYETTRYRMAIDFDRYLEIADPALAARLREPIERFDRRLHTSRFPAQAWIDVDGRVVRLDSQIRTVTGGEVASYRLDLAPATATPAVPPHAVPLRKLAGR
jgi:hypothetical protein